MMIIARTLAVLSGLLTLVAIEIIGVGYFRIGFEATGVFGGYSLLLATVTAVSAIVIASVRARSGKKAGFAFTVLLSGMSLFALAALVTFVTLRNYIDARRHARFGSLASESGWADLRLMSASPVWTAIPQERNKL
jgi:hypothetical protein